MFVKYLDPVQKNHMSAGWALSVATSVLCSDALRQERQMKTSPLKQATSFSSMPGQTALL